MTDEAFANEVVQPGVKVAEAMLRFLTELLEIDRADGAVSAKIAAVAMHNASIAFLRPRIGTCGIGLMLDMVTSEAERLQARDTEYVELAKRRLAARNPKTAVTP